MSRENQPSLEHEGQVHLQSVEMSHEEADTASQMLQKTPPLQRFGRLLLLVVVLIGMAGFAKVMGWEQYFRPKVLKTTIQSAGVYGYLLYLGLFVVSGFFQLPGMLIAITGTFLYGKTVGFLLAFLGGTLMLNIHFLFVRMVGGRALEGLSQPWALKLLSRLEERPIWIVFLLRIPFPLNPQLNTVLALTRLHHRHYFWGSFLGLFGPLLFMVVFSDVVMKWLGL